MLRVVQRLSANVINGMTVALGVALVHLLLLPFLTGPAVTVATSGAVYASLCHLVHRAGRATRRSLAGGAVGALVALVVALTSATPVLLHLGIGLVVFTAMMSLGWGQRAGPISFAAVLALVLSLATGARLPLWQLLLCSLLGSALYAAWAWLSTWLLAGRYRTLAVAATLDASAKLLRLRAEVLEQLDAGTSETSARWAQIDEEARLAALIQAARELVFGGVELPGAMPHTQLLFRAIELRDLVLTSRLDLELLGDNKLAREIRTRLARTLRANAVALEQAELSLKLGTTKALQPVRGQAHVTALLDERNLSATDPRIRLLPAIASRQQQLLDLIASLHELIRGRQPQVPLSQADRSQLASSETWPLREVFDKFELESPVFRHAVRSALALVLAHVLATALPWATHPYWVVLSVAVVLRGTFAQTLARRNQRILGTALGCALAAGTVSIVPEYALSLMFFAAVGVAHAYVNVRYTLTAAAATLMALLQTRLFTVVTPMIVIERLADTVLGAAFAWAFSFVLPSWSGKAVPNLVERTLVTLRAYAGSTLLLGSHAAEQQQLAREEAYEALETLSSTVRSSAAEPRRVRPPIQALLSFIDHAQGLMAQLSSLRLLLLRRREQLHGTDTESALGEARRRLCKRLDLEAAPHSTHSGTHAAQLELPSVPADRAALPWLIRRINISINEAEYTGNTARAALAQLRGDS